jgi:hypothetical protein
VTFAIADWSLFFQWPDVSERYTRVFGLAARITAVDVGVAEETRREIAVRLLAIHAFGLELSQRDHSCFLQK